MRRIAVTLVTAVLVAFVPVGAAAEEPTLAGDVCWGLTAGGYAGDTYAGTLQGGPIAAARVRTVVPSVPQVLLDNPMAVTLTCSIRVGPTFSYTEPAAATATGSGPAAAAVAAPVVFQDPSSWDHYGFCTELAVTDRDGVTYRYYWDVPSSAFSTDPASTCPPLICPTSSDDPCDGPSLWDVVEEYGAPVLELWDALPRMLDAAICEALVEHGDLAPPPVDVREDGDVYVNGEFVWDCPPYEL